MFLSYALAVDVMNPNAFFKAIVYDDVKLDKVEDDVKLGEFKDNDESVDVEVDAKRVVAAVDVRE